MVKNTEQREVGTKQVPGIELKHPLKRVSRQSALWSANIFPYAFASGGLTLRRNDLLANVETSNTITLK